MRNAILISTFIISFIPNLFGQSSDIKKVKYAMTEIDVPTDYKANSEYSIQNNSFSAQWLYLKKEMVEQGIEKQIIQQFEGQLDYSTSTIVEFISNGGQFSGKKYQLKGENKMRFRILAFGSVDGQPLILNLGFKDDPTSNEKLDALMKNFIQFKE